MEKQKVISETKKSIELIQKQFEAFTWDGHVPDETEVQMLKQKVMALYDKLNQLEFVEKAIPVIEERVEVKQEIIPVAEVPAPQEIVQEIKQVEEKIIPVEIQEPQPIEIAETQPSPLRGELERGLTRKEVFETSSNSIAESYNGTTSVHDKISSSKSEVAVADKLKLTPISDLAKAIGINEKFLFIKELFGNNSEIFQRVVSELNSCSDFTMASFHAENETVKKYGVDAQSETYLQFVELIQRRFLR